MFKSILLPHCWVCQGKDGLNDHHVLPQAYGGVDGPQVTLCATHHAMIHKIALSKPHLRIHLVSQHTLDKTKQDKLLQLISLIAKAKAATKHIERPMHINHKLNMERSRKLRELKTLLGKSSLVHTLDNCIDIVYAQFTKLKSREKL